MSEDIAVRIVWKVCKSLYVRVECQILIMRNWVGGVPGSPPPLHPIPSQLLIWMLSPEIKSWLGSAPWSWGMYTLSRWSCFQLSFYLKVFLYNCLSRTITMLNISLIFVNSECTYCFPKIQIIYLLHLSWFQRNENYIVFWN